MTSSWFFLSTLNYDARSTIHQIFHIVHRLRLKIPLSFGDWICLRLQVVKGLVQPAEKFTHIAINLCRKLVHSNIKSVPSTGVERSRFFLYPFHLSMDSVYSCSHNCYWFYTFLGWNWSLLCGTEMVTQRSCRQGYTSFNRIQEPPQTTQTRNPTKNKFHIAVPQTFGTTAQNLVHRAAWRPGLVYHNLQLSFPVYDSR